MTEAIKTKYETVIGLEVHAEMKTDSKMFCGCAVVDSTSAPPNTTVCPVCSGMPGTLPVVNRKAVEFGMKVALALGCTINQTSIFARKNYFYPDMPKGYQISQYELPLAEHGQIVINTPRGEETIRVTRVHLEEDAGKLTHIENNGVSHSLVDLNRAGVPLLEIVSEPDIRSVEGARAYGEALRQIVRYLDVNSGDMEKGVIRFEANISIRPTGSEEFGTRVEVKNLNSFRTMERAIEFETERQARVLQAGGSIDQETLGWNEANSSTYSMRSKEDAHDYRYFPEPDLPPLVVDQAWIDVVRASLPELPRARYLRFKEEYQLTDYAASVLTADRATADYFEAVLEHVPTSVSPKIVSNWVTGELFALINQAGTGIEVIKVQPEALAGLVRSVAEGQINPNTGKTVLGEMFTSGRGAEEIVAARGLKQVSDTDFIARIVKDALDENPEEVALYQAGKESVANWLFGQVMRKAKGKANPQVVRAELEKQLTKL
ncbi:MAG: Asp-tRNA(Asn)/Glu-tRNA(Gln) amidotransferase subunit GatB [Anaerolineales bacterium]|nr:Asp-tRNA(Asn)/Glu-tRNA(Gln) amidotransferase subunit GatB [Anaerolineales bacterium]